MGLGQGTQAMGKLQAGRPFDLLGSPHQGGLGYCMRATSKLVYLGTPRTTPTALVNSGETSAWALCCTYEYS